MSDQREPIACLPIRPRQGSESSPAERRFYRSQDLFGNSNELVILHDAEEYRLRITRNNKLILTK
jgi:hemin uptake protein HemP